MNWKKQAKLARQRDNYDCKVCRRNGRKDHFKVSVHHIKPYREFSGDYKKANQLNNLISLCPSCHPRVESGVIPCPIPSSL
jgi:5-methylcytosine-specific restriction endonuclease McrA